MDLALENFGNGRAVDVIGLCIKKNSGILVE